MSNPKCLVFNKAIVESNGIYRVNGKTTRIIDQLIQDLFNYGSIHVKNEYNNTSSNEYTFDKLKRRLESEHMFTCEDLIFSKKELLIKFKEIDN